MRTLASRVATLVLPVLLVVFGAIAGAEGCAGEGTEINAHPPAPVTLSVDQQNPAFGPSPPTPSAIAPATCAEAAAERSNAGCDFWPTITRNPVWSVFDFAIVVANGNAQETKIRLQRGTTVVAEGVVPANNVGTFPLPWVKALKVLQTNLWAVGGIGSLPIV